MAKQVQLKQRLSRLGPAVRRALQQAEDVAQRRQARELRESQERLGGIVNAAMDAIISVNEQQRIVLFNPAAETMFGWKAAEIIGQPLERLIPERFRRAHEQHIRNYGQTGVTTRRMGELGEIRGLRASGEEFPAEASISQISLAGGKLFTAILRDITERKQSEEALRKSEESLRVANRELDDFATVVSHDLRAPLRAVATLARWLQSDYADKLDEQGRKDLGEMVQRVQWMDRMIEDILHYSRLGRTREKAESVALAALIAEVVHDLNVPASARLHIAEGLPVVQGDPVRLRQVFQNLIGNAIQHTDKSQTDIRVDWADQGTAWEFRVADNGPGIEERHFERIFKLFETVAPKGETESTGVGLALVKRIVERAGGRIGVRSRMGEGSTFWFTWPKTGPADAPTEGKTL